MVDSAIIVQRGKNMRSVPRIMRAKV